MNIKQFPVQDYYDKIPTRNDIYMFVVWLNEVSSVAKNYGIKDDVVETCGTECWWYYFNKGFTPEDALLDDMKYRE